VPRRKFDLILITCIAIINVVWALLAYPNPLLGAILAFPLVFVIPGYALTEAILPEQAQFVFPSDGKKLTASGRLTFSVGLSLVIDILGGFVLNLLTGLRSVPWALYLAMLTMIFSCVAVYRRSQLENQQGQYSPKSFFIPLPRLSIWQGLLLGLSVLLVVASVAFSIQSAENQPSVKFTQFWLLPPSSGNSCSVKIGLQSFEATSVNYQVVMTMNGEPFKTWSGLSMAYQQSWQQSVQLPVSAKSKTMLVAAQLYRQDQPGTIYRQVHVDLHVATNGNENTPACTA
jgi:uncharacterized membrane protein